MVGVTLGLPGPWTDSNYEPADHYSTKIGGLPDWPFPINAAIQALLECNTCGRSLCLVSQVYAPVSSEDITVEERIIYIFGCIVPQCDSHLWRALRVQKISSIEDSLPSCDDVDHTPISLSISESNWHDDLWSLEPREKHGDELDDDIDLEELGRALSQAAHVASTSKRQSNGHESSRKSLPTVQQAIDCKILVAVLPCFYIYTQEEKFVRKVASENFKYPLPSVKVHEDDSEDHSNDETYEEENYEYDKALHADRTYLKFKKRVDEYPEQCFRYSYGGRPLLASGGAVDPGLCRHCRELRHYEMQLMPPLIYFLQEATDPERTLSDKFNWMTLLVFTCSKSCLLSSYTGGCEDWTIAEEEVVVQYE